jgi:hypothetical protein
MLYTLNMVYALLTKSVNRSLITDVKYHTQLNSFLDNCVSGTLLN